MTRALGVILGFYALTVDLPKLLTSAEVDVVLRARDEVLKELKNIFCRAHQKLASKFYGPFKILRRIGSVAYELELPQTSRIHPMFHVSLLQRRMGNKVVQATPLPPLSKQGRPIIEPEEILAARSILRNGKDQEQVLVKWCHLSAEDATWETVAELRSRFPQILLGDKSVLEDRRDDESQKLSTKLKPIPNEEALRRGTQVRKPSWKLRGAA
ncbi:hypothetical protein SASPL_104859 [Salvia splendens]|uniref:Chromo domain-containing protein n=1 Tax=Salvia splendens TaxID=180675 RepID=A0A8X8YIT8_SALSN|nr:hypothetical protein SASPL_104859 [Salvia splendens]